MQIEGIEDIKKLFSSKFGESFEAIDGDGRYLDFVSKSYNLRIKAVFLTPIHPLDGKKDELMSRLKALLNTNIICKGERYNFEVCYTEGADPQYCVERDPA
ncbi:conserved hypothetical protein [Enterobacterales bacterium 8AC]|nr:conserved hypothetical protein [Enterobacterales bacterium 8AC]